MSIDFKEIVLRNYGGFKLKANIDENPEDIIAAICYSDHGDDFLVIKTKDSCYEYGLFVTRKGWDARCLDDENCIERNWLLKMPKLTGKFDYRSGMANEIYSLINDRTIEKGGFFERDKTRVWHDTQYAQYSFNRLCEKLKEIYETGVVYHCNASSYISQITVYLTANDILTEENLQKLEEIRPYFREGAIDGTAGKRECSFYGGDNLHWIYYKGEQVTKKYHKHGIKVKRTYTDDEWGGYEGFCLNIEQFV